MSVSHVSLAAEIDTLCDFRVYVNIAEQKRKRGAGSWQTARSLGWQQEAASHGLLEEEAKESVQACGKQRSVTIRQSKGLTAFVRDECANYSKHDEACLFGDSCKVMDGQRCDCFEKAVLGPPDYKAKLPGYDYQKLFAQYAEQTSTAKQQVKLRRCECGAPLRHRQRYCDDCALKRRRKTKRESQKKYRQVRVA